MTRMRDGHIDIYKRIEDLSNNFRTLHSSINGLNSKLDSHMSDTQMIHQQILSTLTDISKQSNPDITTHTTTYPNGPAFK